MKASDNETVAEIVKEMRRDAVAADAWCETHGEMASAASVLNRHADRIESAHRREYEKYKEHINELNRQILVLKHEYEKRETYLCGYDPDEALVMQCGTCRFFQKKHSHCTHNDSLTSAKYKCSEWKFKTNDECAKEASKKHDEEIVRLRREVAELRECLEQAVVYFCGNDKLADCIEKVYGNPKCETEGQHCMVERWRTALKGEKDEGK